MGELGLCTATDVFAAMMRQLASDIPADYGLPLLLIRLLHNKLFSFPFFFLRCYLLYFDALQVNRFLSPLLLPFIIYATVQRRGRKFIVLSLILFPLFLIFNPLKFNLGTRYYIYVGYFASLSFFGWLKFFLEVYLKSKKSNK